MSEQLQATTILATEQSNHASEFLLANHEGVPSAEVFASEDELGDVVVQSMQDGTITTSYIEEGRADFNPYVRLDEYDVDESKLEGYDRQYKSGRLQELPISDLDKVISKTEAEVTRRVGEQVYADNSWYLMEPNLGEDVANGHVTEQYSITDGKQEIRLVNFSGSLLTPEQAEQVQDVIKRVTALSGGASFDAIKAVCILGSEKFKGDVVGSARGMTGVIVLNESLINGQADSRPDLKFGEMDQNALQTTLTHEMAHLIELKDPQSGAYAKATGWENEINAFTDDYGNARRDNRSVLKTPSIVAVNDHKDQARMVSAVSEFGVDQTIAAKPVTRYAHTNEREDLAEAFVVYANSDRDDLTGLDSLRRGGLEGVLRRASIATGSEFGPHNVQMVQLDAAEKIGTRIARKNYTISEPNFIYSHSAEAVEQPVPPRKLPTIEDAYIKTDNTFVDDYGNEITKYGKHVPRTF